MTRSAAVVAELLLVVAVFAADRRGLVPLSNTPFLLAIGWFSLRWRGLRWRDVGWVGPPRWLPAIGLGVAAGIVIELLALFVTEPLLARLTGRHPDMSDFRALVGNLSLLLTLLVPMWLLAAVGEELFYRGYLLNRATDLTSRSRAGWTLALLLVSALFGAAHGESQGLTGMLQEGLAGLLLGLLYLAAGRSLTIPVVAHGTSNTMAFVLIYLGRYPGL